MKHFVAMSSFIFLKSPGEVLNWTLENNFSGLEIWADVPIFYVDDVKKQDLLNFQSVADNIEFTIHMPIHGPNLCAPNPGIHKETMRQMDIILSWKKLFDISKIVLHAGKVPGRSHEIMSREKEILRRSLDKLRSQAEHLNINLLIENIGFDKIFYDYELNDLIDCINEYDLGLCLDTGHANLSGKAEEIILKIGERVEEMHVHDNFGKSDQHLPAGEGNIDWKLYKKFLSNEEIIMTHEVRESDITGAQSLRGRNNLEQIAMDVSRET